MFSDRTNWDLRHSAFSRLANDLIAAGKPVLDLTESNPTKCGFQLSQEDLLPAFARRHSTVYEPEPQGNPAAREAIAGWYRRQGIRVDPAALVLASGTSEAYGYLLKLLCNPGDVIAVPRPGYPLFDHLAHLHDVRCSEYRFRYDGEWHLDVESLHQSLNERTRAIVLVHPNNPSGSFIKRDEREAILQLSRERNIPLIVDEVFGSYGFRDDSRRAPSFAGVTESLVFTVNGISKLLGLPQMKLGWIAASGPDEERREALKRLEVIADMFLSVSAPVQHALGSLLERSDEIGTPIRERVETNFGLLAAAFASDSPASVLRCEGGWNAIVRMPAVRSDEEWGRLLLESQQVLVYPGSLFSCDIPSSLIISLLIPSERLEAGIGRISAIAGR